MTVLLTSPRKVRAIQTSEAIQQLLDQESYDVRQCDDQLRRNAMLLFGLCYDTPTEWLAALLVVAMADPSVEPLARSAVAALHHELTFGEC